MTVTPERNHKLYGACKCSVVGFESLIIYPLFMELNRDTSAWKTNSSKA